MVAMHFSHADGQVLCLSWPFWTEALAEPCPLQSVCFCLVCTTASAGLFDVCTVEPSGTLNILLQHSWDIMSIMLFLQACCPSGHGQVTSWFQLLMLVLFMAGGSVLWPGCAELHGDLNLRMLLILWEYEVFLQRIPIEEWCSRFPSQRLESQPC